MTREHQQLTDGQELLSTKLMPPQLRGPLIARQRLLQRLDEGLEQKVTLISAPAGFGKTTLVSEWIAHQREAGSLPPLAWVSLDEGDNDPVRFWRYVLTACSSFGEECHEPALTILTRSADPPFEPLLTMFINKMARLPGKVVLALEDYHLITSQQIHESVAFFIDHFPATLHLILMTRQNPPLPLARLRAYNELNELHTADLRFTEEEVRSFLQMALPFALSDGVVEQLTARTEGWPAGLRLVALAVQRMQEQPEVEQYLTTFSGSHRPILEYLVSDVFNAQPEDIQEFLLQTSILDQLTGPLCDALTGRDDSTLVLERLERANLFITPVTEAGAERWYRYHALFVEAMRHHARRRLGQQQLETLARKASDWFEQHNMLPEATEAALYARDYEAAAALIERIIAPRLVQNEFHTLRRWMEQLPVPVLEAFPTICMTFATAILFTSDRHARQTKERVSVPLQIAERYWQQQEDEHRLGEVLAFHSLVDWLQGEYDTSFDFARQALQLLPQSDNQWRGISLIMLGVDQMMSGDLHSARQTVSQALARCQTAQNIYGTLDSKLLLGEILHLQGELDQAGQQFRETLALAERTPMTPVQAEIRRRRALLGLGALALERNDLQEADEALAQVVPGVEQFPEGDLLADSPIVLAKIRFAQGRTEEAQQLLNAAMSGGRQSFLLRFPGVTRVEMALADDDLATAERWAAHEALSGNETWHIQREQEELMLARLHIAQGESDVLPQLERLLAEAQEQGQVKRELEIRIAMALAHQTAGHPDQAREMLMRALQMGQASGFRRVFLSYGQALAQLLRETVSQIEDEALAGGPLVGYGRALLYALAQEQRERTVSMPASHENGATQLFEPLTEQEQKVLRLLAAGLTNPQIAEELVISVNTVKTHVKNIYSKLDVSSREEAREAAQQLDLL